MMHPVSETTLAALAAISQGLARSGRGAGAQAGGWMLRMIESKDVMDDRIEFDNLREVGVVQNARTERHLLRPFDVLVTARAGAIQSALVPAAVSRTVAGVTLLVVRPRLPDAGMGQFIWFYLTSVFGREQLARRTRPGAAAASLSARDLGEISVPVPAARTLERVARLVEWSEKAYTAAVDAARLRRETLRDALVREICHSDVAE